MDYKDREKIDYMCNQLLQDIDINRLWPKLLDNNVYFRDDVNIPNWLRNMTDEETVRDICSEIKTRGPNAFKNLILSLKQSGHHNVASQLENYGSSTSANSINRHVQTNFQNPSNSNEISSTFEQMLNINSEEVNYSTESSNNSTEPSSSSSLDEDTEDNYWTKIDKHDEPLKIQVKKAEEFKDTPEFEKLGRYVMRSCPRGYALIITNIAYKLLDCRPSATHDQNNLKELFEQIGYKTITYSNLTGREIREAVRNFSQMKELRRVDSVFVVISSHGDGSNEKQKTEIKGTDYGLPSYESVFCTNITDYFTSEQCPQLKEKPKIFIFQTCRGNKHQKAVSVSRSVTDSITVESSGQEVELEFSTRNYSDTLIAYATLPGYYAYRDKYNGSWFIQILCEVFMNHAHDTHVQDLLSMTDRRLEIVRASNNRCQTTWVINKGFNKHCYLNPGLFNKSKDVVK